MLLKRRIENPENVERRASLRDVHSRHPQTIFEYDTKMSGNGLFEPRF